MKQDIRHAACTVQANLSGRTFQREDGTINSMLRKCANPACTVPFRSLREGKLFLAETTPHEPDESVDAQRKKLRREHFWLCQSCSDHFTLRFDLEQGMMTVPLKRDGGQPRWAEALA